METPLANSNKDNPVLSQQQQQQQQQQRELIDADGQQLLPFQRNILNQLMPFESSNTGNSLLIMARGLGIRRIVTTMLRVYDSSDYLVIIVNASPEEERSFAEELGMRVKLVGFELPAATREAMYKQGGIFSVTSRILTVDMLNQKLPIALVTGLIVMHAETVTPESSEAFVVRLYRQHNKEGFLKAFSDQPEQFTFGISPLQTVLQQLKIRQVIIIPRFHDQVDKDLQKRKADVVELYQPLSSNMLDIQTAILECMELTLSEIKRSNTYLEVEEFTVENALFRSFESLVRRQLEPVWHKVGPRTRSYVNDLSTLRKLQNYLLSFDSIQFLRYIETLLSSQSDQKNQSAWLFTKAAETIIQRSKQRVYIKKVLTNLDQDVNQSSSTFKTLTNKHEQNRQQREMTTDGIILPDDIQEDEFFVADEIESGLEGPTAEEEEMLRQMEQEEDERRQNLGLPPLNSVNSHKNNESLLNNEEQDIKPDVELLEKQEQERIKQEQKVKQKIELTKKWLPPDVELILEQQPKWLLLSDVLDEIENNLHWSTIDLHGYSNDTILIMCNSTESCKTIGEYLESKTLIQQDDQDSNQTPGHQMMISKVKDYFFWKGRMGKMQRNLKKKSSTLENKVGSGGNVAGSSGSGSTGSSSMSVNNNNGSTQKYGTESAALKRKQEWQRGQAPSTKRRRVRGGGNVNVVGDGANHGATGTATKLKIDTVTPESLDQEAGDVADFLDASDVGDDMLTKIQQIQQMQDLFDPTTFEEYFGIVSNEDLVIVRPYSDDDDDKMLEEVRPKYVIMYDPDPAFVRRLEAYRAAHGNCAIRVYFLAYKDSVEEQKYLSSIRKEKDAFERLIRERGSMAITIEAEYRPGEEESNLLRTVNTRRAGGRQVETEQPRIIVDVREFRSSLPSLLHLGGIEVVPLTIGVGDYVITPDMAVERKSLPDLISSFNSGRLFQQCEIMTAHYQQPILLIEFDEKRSFNLESYSELKPSNSSIGLTTTEIDLRSKLVLLTIAFPRLRIIWSSSPYETVLTFKDLKRDRLEPNIEQALLTGVDEVDAQNVVQTAGIDTTTTTTTGGRGLRKIGNGMFGESTINTTCQEILKNLPGISIKNLSYVMNKIENLENLIELNLNQMKNLIGVDSGIELFNFVNQDVRKELG
ncbi:DNA repair protein RAD16 [Microbotryomycetes sp. JL221]|nr:DNA repair protein RAD16 [Microbotryomycetes sp. JL221]